MSWYETAIPVIRSLVNDPCGDTYTDARLMEVLLTSAFLLQNDVELITGYTINFSAQTITPDPTEDTAYLNLMILRAAYIISMGEYRLSSSQSVKIIDGPSTIDLTSRNSAAKSLYESMKKNYDQAILDYQLGVNNPGVAVLSPYTQENTSYPYGDINGR